METALRTYQLGYAALGRTKVETITPITAGIKTPAPSTISNATPTSYISQPQENWFKRNNINIGTVGQGVNSLVQFVNLIKGNPTQPIYITNPETGQRQEMSQEQKQQILRSYETGGASAGNEAMQQILQMMMINQMNQNSQNKNPDNTGLYIGLGIAGVLVLGGVILIATKK